ncbi:MAG: hypothetical protein ACR2OC_01805 [Solirubrobacterales bacterium]
MKRIGEHLRNQWMGALALFLVIAGGGAYAAFDPVGSDGDIDACFEKKSGDLDIQKGKKCGKGEKQLAWSQVGPQGEAGQPGQQGAPGEAGVAGSQGPAGSARAYGRVSDTGVLSRGRNATVVPKPGEPSRYCITPGAGIDPATTVLIVTPDDTDSNTGAKAYWDSGDTSCPGGFNVLTLNAASAPAPESFSFMVP